MAVANPTFKAGAQMSGHLLGGRKAAVIAKVRISDIEFNPLNVYGILKRKERIDWLKESWQLHRRFINHPIVCPKPGGKYLCITGEGRLIALEELGQKHAFCEIYRGLTHEEAMRILGEDNAVQRMDVPTARAIESYWVYRDVLKESQDPEYALEYAKNVYVGGSIFESYYIRPGWLLAHSRIVRGLMERAGPRRENLHEIEHERQPLIHAKLYMLEFIAKPFDPLLDYDYLAPPPDEDVDSFDKLLERLMRHPDVRRLRKPAFVAQFREPVAEAALSRAERLAEEAVTLREQVERSGLDMDGVVSAVVRAGGPGRRGRHRTTQEAVAAAGAAASQLLTSMDGAEAETAMASLFAVAVDGRGLDPKGRLSSSNRGPNGGSGGSPGAVEAVARLIAIEGALSRLARIPRLPERTQEDILNLHRRVVDLIYD